MGNLFKDVRYGFRMLAKNPAFTAIAVISLGLGIGANTTIFSFVNALLLRPPAVEAPAKLVEVWNLNLHGSGIEHYLPLNYPDYVYYRDHNQVFSSMLAFDGEPHMVIWSRSGQGEKTQGALVSGNFFDVLGVKPTSGRAFLPDEDQTPGAHPVVVLSHAFWEQRLAADPGALGKKFNFNGTTFTAVGIAPAGFSGIIAGIQPDFWTPLAMTFQLTRDPNRLTNHDSYWLFGTGRLKVGVTPPQAQADLNVLSHHLQRDYPKSNDDKEAALFPVTLVPGPFRGYVAAFTGILMAVVGLVLLIACANAANLLLAQANARRRETAIRAALGAGRGRLIRQILVESTLVAFLGGCAAFLLASWMAPALLTLTPPSLPIKLDVPLDWRVLAFTLAVSLATGVIFGLAPAFRAARVDVIPVLKDEGGIGGYRRSKLRNVLVVAQISVCLVLLVSAGLCVRSLMNAQSIDPGFDTRHVLMAEVDPGTLGYSESKGRAFYQELVGRVEALPGVKSVSTTGYLPLTTNQDMAMAGPERQANPAQGLPAINTTDVGPGYFKTMGIPLLQGREFTAQDGPGSPGVAIINQAMAKSFWPGENPVGQRLRLPNGSNPATGSSLEIVGVVRTGKYRTLSEDALPFFYRPMLQAYHSKLTLVVRAAGDPHSLLPEVRREIQSLDPNVVPFDMETMQEYMALPLFPAHTTGWLLGAFGFLALVLAVGGLYGVMAYAVSQRTHEIGVRLALGAARVDVIKLMVRQGMLLTLIGIGIGLAGALAATRVLSSLLYGISATDPLTFVGVSLILAGVALVANYIPARRATKVDPMVALRYQ
ncbi:MAG TPA: ABC transporter permease [Terriglobia bacterium]|nr:ABC transporter permease [Terriglobia bacterium]